MPHDRAVRRSPGAAVAPPASPAAQQGSAASGDAAAPAGPHAFATRLVAWQALQGRHDLPWQGADPYRVWLSEIMLQQTQVSVVIDYFGRFVARFPTIEALAAAPLDDVLAAWSGLGYYQRARNLHRCAGVVVAQHGGEFPRSAAALAALPGIGESTAAAIAAFCFGERAAILDGNVRRVLCRAFGVDLPAGTAAANRRLWELARSLLPDAGLIAPYTQGLMDLGATLCKPRRPECGRCPFEADCSAHGAGAESDLPARRPRNAQRPQRETVVLWMRRAADDRLWLEKRPPAGIWPGLWSLPEFASEDAALEFAGRFGPIVQRQRLAPIRHGFTHFELTLRPLLVDVDATAHAADAGSGWTRLADAPALALPAPVRALLAAGDPAPPAAVR